MVITYNSFVLFEFPVDRMNSKIFFIVLFTSILQGIFDKRYIKNRYLYELKSKGFLVILLIIRILDMMINDVQYYAIISFSSNGLDDAEGNFINATRYNQATTPLWLISFFITFYFIYRWFLREKFKVKSNETYPKYSLKGR